VETAGTISEVFCQPGQTVAAGRLLDAIKPDM